MKAVWELTKKLAANPKVRTAAIASAPKAKEQAARLGRREQAIKNAGEVGGRFSEATIANERYWIVWKGEKPINSFPQFPGDLQKALKDHDPARSKATDDLGRARLKKRLKRTK